jgi:hypothetical protein
MSYIFIRKEKTEYNSLLKRITYLWTVGLRLVRFGSFFIWHVIRTNCYAEHVLNIEEKRIKRTAETSFLCSVFQEPFLKLLRKFLMIRAVSLVTL